MKKFRIMQNSDASVTVQMSLPQELVESFGGDTEEIRKTALALLRQHAEGAIIIRPALSARLKAIGLETDDQVAQMAEKGAGRTPGRYCYEVSIDRAFVPAIERIAKTLNLTVDAVLSSAVNYGIAQGWVYHINKEWIVLRLTPEQLRIIANAMGVKEHKVDGQALAEFMSHAFV